MTDIFVAKTENSFEPQELEKKPFENESRLANLYNKGGKNVGLFSSFILYPQNISFKEQEDDEEIILFLRKHFITNFDWIFLAVFMFLLPFVFFIFRDFSPIPQLPTVFTVIAFLFYSTVICAFLYINFISWYFNVSIITQKRLIDVHIVDVIYHDMAVTKLNLVEDISFTQSGFVRSFFNYGDIFAQTAGEKMHFDFLAVPEPDHVLNIIQNLMGGEKHVR
jgi:hypothetical protein